MSDSLDILLERQLLEPPHDFAARVMKAITLTPRSILNTSPVRERLQWLALAAALVLVTLGVYAIAQPDAITTPAPPVGSDCTYSRQRGPSRTASVPVACSAVSVLSISAFLFSGRMAHRSPGAYTRPRLAMSNSTSLVRAAAARPGSPARGCTTVRRPGNPAWRSRRATGTQTRPSPARSAFTSTTRSLGPG